jgi:hypothetical protein
MLEPDFQSRRLSCHNGLDILKPSEDGGSCRFLCILPELAEKRVAEHRYHGPVLVVIKLVRHPGQPNRPRCRPMGGMHESKTGTCGTRDVGSLPPAASARLGAGRRTRAERLQGVKGAPPPTRTPPRELSARALSRTGAECGGKAPRRLLERILLQIPTTSDRGHPRRSHPSRRASTGIPEGSGLPSVYRPASRCHCCGGMITKYPD